MKPPMHEFYFHFFFFQFNDDFGIDILKLTDTNDVSNISHQSRASGKSKASNLDMHTWKINSSVKLLWSRSLLLLLHCIDIQEDTLIMKYKADTSLMPQGRNQSWTSPTVEDNDQLSRPAQFWNTRWGRYTNTNLYCVISPTDGPCYSNKPEATRWITPVWYYLYL